MSSRISWARAYCSVLLGALSCAPQPSALPLGVGPLALAERDAVAQATARAEARAASRAEPSAREARAGAGSAPRAEEPKESKAPPPSAGEAKDDSPERETPGAAPASSFAGLYAGNDVALYRVPGLPDREELDDQAKIRVEDAAPGAVLLALVNSADGSDLCSLSARLEGSTAVLDPGQPCFESEGEGDTGVHGELTSGRAVFEGEELRLEAVGVLTLTFPDQEIEGELTYTFKGRRR